jgi:DNA-binding Lrp family transcriptional regulator
MSTILAEVRGFTPLIDALVDDVGLIQAAVYGKVWRYCQMKDGACSASQETIAKELKVSRITVLRHLKELCRKGYLKDTTPNVRNRPHVYADTGKAKIMALIAARVGVTESDTSNEKGDSTVTESNSTVTESNTQVSLKVTRREHDTNEESKDVVPNSDEEPMVKSLADQEDAESTEEFTALFGEGRTDTLSVGHWTDKIANSPWLAWHPDRVHPQAGVSAGSLQRVGWLVEDVTGLCPVDGEWKGWIKGCVSLYQAAKGEWGALERGIRNVWRREEKYRPGHIRGFVDEVRKASSAKPEAIGW